MCRDLIDRKGPITLGKEKAQRKKRRKERAWRVCGDRKMTLKKGSACPRLVKKMIASC